MPRHYMRPHIGKVPMKFYFRAQDITVTMPGIDIAGKLVLVWKRGSRRSTTEPFPVKEKLSSIDGSLSRTATTTQDLALICTMFKVARAPGPRVCATTKRPPCEDVHRHICRAFERAP